MSEVSSKTVMITGCTSGIGFATSKYLIEEGYQLLMIGRNEQKLAQISELLGEQKCYVCNLENIDDISGIFRYCEENEIKLDGLVHSAGYVINTPIRLFDDANMVRQMQINYYAFAELCKGFQSRKVSNECSSIVAISSFASLTKDAGSSLYASSKSALNTFVQIAAKEFSKRRIRVNAVLPAYVDTRMTDGLTELIDLKARQPFGMIPPIEVAYLVEFLLSDKAMYITGSLIPISGGMGE